MRKLGLAAFILLLASSCNEYELATHDNVDVFFQNPADKVDILLVVDNSGSMLPYQVKLGSNFQEFLTYFVEAEVDYHIGVTTTDTVVDAGAIRGEIITPETEDPDGVFEDIVRVGTTGSGYEMGLEAAKLAFEPQNAATNSAFLRDDAKLSIIWVSDEEDSSPLGAPEYVDYFKALKGGASRDAVTLSALVAVNLDDCPPSDYTTQGDRYVFAATKGQGIIGNLCAADFGPIVTELSLNTSRLRDVFYLSDSPIAPTLRVLVDNEDVPCDEGEWTLQLIPHEETGDETWAIVFDRLSLPSPGEQVAARYNPGDTDLDLFCGGTGGEE